MNDIYTTLIIATAAVMLLALAVELFYYIGVYARVLRLGKRQAAEAGSSAIIAEGERPSVTVVVVAHNSDADLSSYLPLLCEQDYPRFSVLVVNDSSWDNTEEVIRQMRKIYPNLDITRVPLQARLISHKKFAILLAALHFDNDILIFTEPSCRPFSQHWIDMTVSRFGPETDYVIGMNVINDHHGLRQHIIAYGMMLRSLHILGMAAMGAPYAASSRNMAYRRSAFFAHDGFRGTMHKSAGEDDLTINRHGNRHNVRVEARVPAHTVEMEHYTTRTWRYEKQRLCSTLPDYSAGSLFLLRLEPAMRYIYYMCLAANLGLLLTVAPAWMATGLAVAAGTYIIKETAHLTVVNIAARRYRQPVFVLTAILGDILQPILSGLMLAFTPRAKNLF